MNNKGFTLRDETAVEFIKGKRRVVDYRYIYFPDGRKGSYVRRIVRPEAVTIPNPRKDSGGFIVGLRFDPKGRPIFYVVNF